MTMRYWQQWIAGLSVVIAITSCSNNVDQASPPVTQPITEPSILPAPRVLAFSEEVPDRTFSYDEIVEAWEPIYEQLRTPSERQWQSAIDQVNGSDNPALSHELTPFWLAYIDVPNADGGIDSVRGIEFSPTAIPGFTYCGEAPDFVIVSWEKIPPDIADRRITDTHLVDASGNLVAVQVVETPDSTVWVIESLSRSLSSIVDAVRQDSVDNSNRDIVFRCNVMDNYGLNPSRQDPVVGLTAS